MAWKSIVPGTELSDVKSDRKNAVSIEKYKVSPNAIYLNGEYLPTSVITDKLPYILFQQFSFKKSLISLVSPLS